MPGSLLVLLLVAQQPGSFRGEISAMTGWLPRKDATESRAEARVEAEKTIRPWLRIHADAAVDGLAADRAGAVTDLFGRVNDVWMELSGARGDLRVGYGRIVWGRLDEVQPTDVINPIDAARFILMGRSEARRAVAFARGRLFASERFTLEGVVAPVFRRGTFDELDESSSPFNLVRDLVLPASVETTEVRHDTPATAWTNISGGARAYATFGRVDVSGSVYRGFDSFGILAFEPDRGTASPGPPHAVARALRPAQGAPSLSRGGGPEAPLPASARGYGEASPERLRREGGRSGGARQMARLNPVLPRYDAAVIGTLVERYPRFTMLGADFETVTGDWSWRGEVAAFVEKRLAAGTSPDGVAGRVLEAGFGVDRRAGDYRLFASAIARREWSDEDPGVNRTNVNLVGSIERSFGRDRYRARVFSVVNPGDAAAFVRGVLSWSLQDNVAIEGSAAAFLGTSDDALGRFKERDFVFARLRYWF